MAGKFRETVIHDVPKEKAQPKTSEEKNEEIAVGHPEQSGECFAVTGDILSGGDQNCRLNRTEVRVADQGAFDQMQKMCCIWCVIFFPMILDRGTHADFSARNDTMTDLDVGVSL